MLKLAGLWRGVDAAIVLIAGGDDEKEAVEELGEHLSLKLEESV